MRIFFTIIDDWRGQRRDLWLEGDTGHPAGVGRGVLDGDGRPPTVVGRRPAAGRHQSDRPRGSRRRHPRPAPGPGAPRGPVRAAGELRAVAGPHSGGRWPLPAGTSSDRPLRRRRGQPGPRSPGVATPRGAGHRARRDHGARRGVGPWDPARRRCGRRDAAGRGFAAAGGRHRPDVERTPRRPGRGGSRRNGRTVVQPPTADAARGGARDGPLPGAGSRPPGRQLSPGGLDRPGRTGRGAGGLVPPTPVPAVYVALPDHGRVQLFQPAARRGQDPPGAQPGPPRCAAAGRGRPGDRPRAGDRPAAPGVSRPGGPGGHAAEPPLGPVGAPAVPTRTSCVLRVGLADLPATISRRRPIPRRRTAENPASPSGPGRGRPGRGRRARHRRRTPGLRGAGSCTG